MSSDYSLTPLCIVYVDGIRLDQNHEGALVKVVVSDRFNGIGTAELCFDADSFDVRTAGVLVFDSRVRIFLGYKDRVGEVFSGFVTGFRSILRGGEARRLVVCVHNALSLLNRGQRRRSFADRTPSALVRGLVEAHDLKAAVTDFGEQRELFVQDCCTDYRYLRSLAGSYGLDVYAFGDTVYVSDRIMINSDDVIFEWGKNLVFFEASETDEDVLDSFTVSGRNYLKDEALLETARRSCLGRKLGGAALWKGRLQDYAGAEPRLEARSGAEAHALAEAVLVRNSFRYGGTFGMTPGCNALFPGMVVSLKGFSCNPRCNGEYLARRVYHVFGRGSGYTTSFSLERNAVDTGG
jgi:phage protein D